MVQSSDKLEILWAADTVSGEKCEELDFIILTFGRNNGRSLDTVVSEAARSRDSKGMSDLPQIQLI